MTRDKRFRARRLALMAGVAATVLALGDIGVSPVRIALPAGEGPVSVEAVRLEHGLFAAAYAQSAVTLENVTIDAGPSVYRLPSVTIEGSSLSREALLDAIQGKTDAPWHEALAGISAERITMPELIIEQEVEEAQTTITYRDLVAEDVSEGVIARFVAGSARIAAKGPDGRPFEGEIGETVVEGFDLPFTVRWYTDAAPEDGENPFRPIYRSFSVADMRFGDSDAPTAVSVGRMAGETIEGRLMREPFTQMMPEIEAMAEADEEPGEEDTRRMLGMMADMLGSVRFGQVVVEDVAVTVAEAGDEPVFAVERIVFGGDGPARAETIRVDSEQVRLTIAAVVSEGFSFEPMIAGMRRIAEGEVALDASGARALAPTVGTLRLEELAGSIVPPGRTEAVDLTLAAFAMTADDLVEGTPTSIRASFDNLAFALPEGSGQGRAAQLRALGYDEVDLSGAFAARWNPQEQTLAIEEAVLTGVEMGRFGLAAEFGNIGPGVFSGDQMAAMMAAAAATARKVSVSIADAGLTERLLEMQAGRMGATADDLRGQGVMLARTMVPAALGGTPEALALGEALATFLEAPGELDVSVSAVDPAGIPLAAAMQTDDPLSLLPLVTIEAQAR
ncbi:hypothetical protein [Salinarimonas rosea]|uniref:hypothetical protein n=1 Tax=Salinarimonas rosea TaxID=552063 RepID=UPI0004016523|nr:hypothetical protein [Salinarimonas rosea]